MTPTSSPKTPHHTHHDIVHVVLCLSQQSHQPCDGCGQVFLVSQGAALVRVTRHKQGRCIQTAKQGRYQVLSESPHTSKDAAHSRRSKVGLWYTDKRGEGPTAAATAQHCLQLLVQQSALCAHCRLNLPWALPSSFNEQAAVSA